MSIRLNLLPREFRQTQARNRHIQIWTALLVPVALLLGTLVVLDGVRRAQAAEARGENDTLQEELEVQRSQVRALTGSVAELSLQLKRSDALRAKRNWSGMFALIGRCLPKRCWLTSVATDPHVAPAGGASRVRSKSTSEEDHAPEAVTIDAPRKLRIEGYALDAAEPVHFVANLKQAGVFKDVRLVRSMLHAEFDPPRFRFELICEW